MSYLFSLQIHFNDDISRWNTSNVKSMHCMFIGCSKFNQDLSKWDVSQVIDMENMFRDCKSFNQDLGNWNIRNVRIMKCMFMGCCRFCQNLTKWIIHPKTKYTKIFKNSLLMYEGYMPMLKQYTEIRDNHNYVKICGLNRSNTLRSYKKLLAKDNEIFSEDNGFKH
jgi:surface protein